MIVSKKSFFIPLLVFMSLLINCLSSCSSDDGNDDVIIMPTLSYKGSFVSAVHPTSGMVTINNAKTKLAFTSFMSDNGPNLDVYLVSDINNINSDFINLGDLKGLSGSHSYDLPTNIDYAVYKYVVIWCSDFDVNFGYATLSKQ